MQILSFYFYSTYFSQMIESEHILTSGSVCPSSSLFSFQAH